VRLINLDRRHLPPALLSRHSPPSLLPPPPCHRRSYAPAGTSTPCTMDTSSIYSAAGTWVCVHTCMCSALMHISYSVPTHMSTLPSPFHSHTHSAGDRLIVIVNNDRQATMKKGKPFMPARERVKMIRALSCVDAAIEAVDDDR
jgi:hypothetical protein